MHVIDSLALGGAERVLLEIANRTVVDGHEVSVCVTRNGCALANELRPEIRLWVLDRRSRFDRKGLQSLAAILKKEGVDLLQAHGRSTFAFLAFAKMVGLVRCPIILHDHFGMIELDESVPLWFRVWAKRFTMNYVGVCNRLGHWGEAAGIAPKKISVIENALNLTRIQNATPVDLRHEFGIQADVPIGLVVGGLRHEKGIDILLQALAISKYGRSAKILVVGGERSKEYADKCRLLSSRLNLTDTVLFVGERGDVPNLIRSVDFGLLPSRSESGPLVLIEYLAGALPVVFSTVGGIARRAVNFGVEGSIQPQDPEACAEAIDELLSLRTSDRVMRGKAGQDIASIHFDINTTIPQWYQVYRGALASAAQ